MMKQLIAQNQVTQQQNQKVQSEMQKSIHELERQMGQMTLIQNVRPPGTLPSDTKKNPKDCKAVTLRNGRELEEVPLKKKNITKAELIPAKRAEPKTIAEQPVEEVVRPPLLFPQRLQKQKADSACKKFLELLKQVHINIPLVELFQEVPKYAKYIKDVVSNKRRWIEFETVALTEECSSRVRSKIPPKLKDPGSFTISITIGNIEVGLALCVLGASINLMPTFVFRTLGLGEPRPTTITLQLADRSLAYPDGIIEDVLVKIGPFILPVDFVILDFEADKSVPLIIGRGFLATVDAMSMTVDGQEAIFDVFKATKLPAHYEELKMISMVEPELTNAELDHFLASRDPLETTLVYGEDLMIDAKVKECLSILDTSCAYLGANTPFEELDRPKSWKKPKPSIEEAPLLELNPLPYHLRYAFLGSADTLPVIVSAYLTDVQVERVLRVLRDRIRALGWSIADIRGISSSFCMHKILLEEDNKPSV
ncbi:uncharacterized protein LOC132038536 [Lycium ferocissimum]|uniref:uncharacterized protein LOC132038536 n=1 Tax=Lycium ferocissimum TaxID=112874 RepID=UPI002814C00A|nr:uncharacterized protein LOC132038536 [Lycium ferocissimum]